jgi:hypothetical protein
MARICDLCKSENDDKNQFCDKCGNPLMSLDGGQDGNVNQEAVDAFLRTSTKEKPKSSGVGIIIGAVVLLIIGLVAFITYGSMKTKNDVKEVVASFLGSVKEAKFAKALEFTNGIPMDVSMESAFKEFLKERTPPVPINSELQAAKASLGIIGEGIEKYNYINRKYPSSLADLSPVIIEKLPAAPGGGEFGYEHDTAADNYTVYVKGIYFDKCGLAKDLPAFSKQGQMTSTGEKKLFGDWALKAFAITDVQVSGEKATVSVKETSQFGLATIEKDSQYRLKKDGTRWIIDLDSSSVDKINLELSFTQMEPLGGNSVEGKRRMKDNEVPPLGMVLLTFSQIATNDALNLRLQFQYRKTKEAMDQINSALQRYTNGHYGNFPKSLQWLIPNYLSVIPENPTTLEDTFTNAYQVSDDFQHFTLYCDGHRFGALGYEPNFPQYTSRYRLLEKSSQIPEPEEEKKPEEEVEPGDETKPDEEKTPGDEVKPGEEKQPDDKATPGEEKTPSEKDRNGKTTKDDKKADKEDKKSDEVKEPAEKDAKGKSIGKPADVEKPAGDEAGKKSGTPEQKGTDSN